MQGCWCALVRNVSRGGITAHPAVLITSHLLFCPLLSFVHDVVRQPTTTTSPPAMWCWLRNHNITTHHVLSLCLHYITTHPALALCLFQEELDDLTQEAVTYLHGHTGPVYAVDYNLDHSLLFSGSADGTARLWSTQYAGTHQSLAAYRGHMYPIWDVAACPHGLYFASGSSDKTARLWTTERVQALRVFCGECLVCFLVLHFMMYAQYV